MALIFAFGIYVFAYAGESMFPLLRRIQTPDSSGRPGAQIRALKALRSSRHLYDDLIDVVRLTSIAAVFILGYLYTAIILAQSTLIVLLILFGMWVGMLLARLLVSNMVRGMSDSALLRLGVLVQILYAPGMPLAKITSPLIRRESRPEQVVNGYSPSDTILDQDDSVEEEIATEPLEPEERRMIRAILNLEDTAIREIMVPRVDVIAFDETMRVEEAIVRILESGHSRIPVYHETLDTVIGILYSRDLLALTTGPEQDDQIIRDLVRNPFFVPESKRVDDLLREFQEKHVHIAVVVDEYGGTAGIITIEDLIEEIVGEIEDEFDANDPTIQEEDSGAAIVDARIEVDTFNAFFSSAIGGEGYETLGGFLFSRLGKIPAAGDVVIENGLQMEVLSTIGRRIIKVRVIALPPETSNSEFQMS